MIDLKIPKFKVKQDTSISKKRETFAKSLKKVSKTNPTTYKLMDLARNLMKGGFNTEELQKVKHPDVFLVEKILSKKEKKIWLNCTYLAINTNHGFQKIMFWESNCNLCVELNNL